MMAHPLTKFAWVCVGGTIALATIWSLKNAEPEVQLACKLANNPEIPSLYECTDTQTGEVILLTCRRVAGLRYSNGLLGQMTLRAIPSNCSEQTEEGK